MISSRFLIFQVQSDFLIYKDNPFGIIFVPLQPKKNQLNYVF